MVAQGRAIVNGRGGARTLRVMSMLPAVRAQLAERFIVNFRMTPHAMRRFLPVDWLEPEEVGGFAIASFCMLDLRNITVAPLPAIVGLSSLSCAPRYAVLDRTVDPPRPAVFVTERYTNSAFGAWFTTLGFSAPHPQVGASIVRRDDEVTLSVAEDARAVFSARVTRGEVAGSIFTNTQFAQFLARGVSSYGLSIRGGKLTRVDLHKNDGVYEPLSVIECSGPAIEPWLDAGAVLDSAFRTTGGLYEWDYLGLTE